MIATSYYHKGKQLIMRLFNKDSTDIKKTFEEYRKKGLDIVDDLSYDVSQATIQVRAAVEEITPEKIVTTPGDSYAPEIIDIAKILRDMKLQYSIHSSALAAKLFDAQDSLGLDENEITAILGHIINQKKVITESTQAAVSIILASRPPKPAVTD